MDKNNILDYLKQLKYLDEQINDAFDNIESEDNLNRDIGIVKNLTGVIASLENDIKKTSIINPKLDINIQLLHENAVKPTYAKHGDAGMDLTITSIIKEDEDKITYGYGLAIEIPEGYVGLIFPRSSISKMDVLMTNGVGVVDSGYRGELMSVFKKTGASDKLYSIGDRGAQLLILPYPSINFIVTDDLSKTVRGNEGYGSTGN